MARGARKARWPDTSRATHALKEHNCGWLAAGKAVTHCGGVCQGLQQGSTHGYMISKVVCSGGAFVLERRKPDRT